MIEKIEYSPSLYMPGFVKPVRIYSLDGAELPPNAEDLVVAGKHLWDDPEFFMAKMLEYDGRYIRFNPDTKQWLGKHIDLDIVEEFFPGFRNYVGLKSR